MMLVVTDLSGDPRRGRRVSTDQSADRVRDEPPVLPSTPRDESAEGWSERADTESDDERFLRERPPHHEG
ncbi:hypothetical protein BH18ACT7_BH18ACT7_01490 [soil metagenome]